MNFCILHTDDTCSFLGLFFQLQRIRSQYLEQFTENILFQFLINICCSIYNLASSHLFQ